MTRDRFADASLDRLVDLTLRALTDSGGGAGIDADPSNASDNRPPDPSVAGVSAPPALTEAELVQLRDRHLRDTLSQALRGLEPPKAPPTGGSGSQTGHHSGASATPRNPMLQPPVNPAVDLRR